MARQRRAWRAVLLLVCCVLAAAGQHLACASETVDTSSHTNSTTHEEHGPSQQSKATSMVVVAILIILLSAVFEKLQHHLIHAASKDTQAVIHSLFQELTVMGFISLLLFVGQSLSFIEKISWLIYGDGEDEFLGEVFHTAHYVLFLVMALFLFTSVIMIRVASGQEAWWRKAELEVHFRKGSTSREPQGIGKLGRIGSSRLAFWCSQWCARNWRTEQYELAIYDALRERFVNPENLTPDSSSRDTLASSTRLTASLVLDHKNAGLYQKKLTVYAFETRDPVRFEKHWGSSSGERGDMVVVGLEGDLYVCPQHVFQSTYQPVVGTPNMYRKTGALFAKKMHSDFVVNTPTGLHSGVAGSYLVQDAKTGDQYVITGVEFEQNYELVESKQFVSTSGVPHDFDFAEYLVVAQGHLLRQIVEVSLPTWGVAASLLTLQYVQIMLFPGTNVASALAFALLMVFAAALVRHKLLHIRRMLLPKFIPQLYEEIARQHDHGPHTVVDGSSAHVPNVPPPPIVAFTDDPVQDVGIPQLTSSKSSERGFAVSISTHTSGSTRGVTTLNVSTPPASPAELSKPLFMSQRMGQSRLSARVTGRESNLHERLFWFDALGSQFLMEFVRCALLVNAIYVAASIPLSVVPACSNTPIDSGKCAGMIASMLLPPLATSAFIPSILALLTVVSNVELLKKNKIIGDVLRRQRTARSMRALRLVSALRTAASKTTRPKPGPASHSDEVTLLSPGARSRMSRSRPSSLQIQGAAERVYGKPSSALYRKREMELMSVFRIFDRNNTGGVSRENLESLMHLLGMGDAAPEAAERIVRELDVDHSDSVDFQEFFDWMALHDHDDVVPEDLANSLFDMIDRDRSGDISAAELRDILLSLGEAMSQEDVLLIVREADPNGSGTIDRREFAELMERYLKGEH